MLSDKVLKEVVQNRAILKTTSLTNIAIPESFWCSNVVLVLKLIAGGFFFSEER